MTTFIQILLSILSIFYFFQIIVILMVTSFKDIKTKKEFLLNLIPFYWLYKLYTDLE